MTDNQYPFHTGELEEFPDGYLEHWEEHEKEVDNPQLIVGLVWRMMEGRIYEFQDPESHDDYFRATDPRDDETITFDSWGDRMFRGDLIMMLEDVPMPAEVWVDLRESYIENEEWSESWKEATPSHEEHMENLSRASAEQNQKRNKL